MGGWAILMIIPWLGDPQVRVTTVKTDLESTNYRELIDIFAQTQFERKWSCDRPLINRSVTPDNPQWKPALTVRASSPTLAVKSWEFNGGHVTAHHSHSVLSTSNPSDK